jgi:hypothetical protein
MFLFLSFRSFKHIVMVLINALPGNSFVNTNTGNNRTETVFYAVVHGAVGNLPPGNEVVNMHPQTWETVFSVGSVQRSYLKDDRLYESVLSSRWKIATDISS